MTEDGEIPVASSPRTLVCDSEEIEGLGSFLPAAFAILRCEASEFQQAFFAIIQLQPELGEGHLEFIQIGLCFRSTHKIVHIAHDDHISTSAAFTPPFYP